QYTNKVILCSLNKTDLPESTFVLDYIGKTFKSSHEVDPVIKLNKPLTVLIFPAFHNQASNLNHLLYSHGKSNELNETFINAVLRCEDMMTAAENKDGFELVVQRLAGDKVDANMLSNIYEEIDQIVQKSEEEEAEEVPNLAYNDVEHILSS